MLDACENCECEVQQRDYVCDFPFVYMHIHIIHAYTRESQMKPLKINTQLY